jgi:hypothetical protein
MNEFSSTSANQQTLEAALRELNGDPPSSIPFLVWLLENPASPMPLPGKIDLYRHDCLHVLLKKGFSLQDEAFVVGFTMGNDVQTNWFHVLLFKWFSCRFYPKLYRFTPEHLRLFDLGYFLGRVIKVKNLNQVDFSRYQQQSIAALRHQFGIDCKTLQILQEAEAIFVG